jgi:peroxiredoxin
MKNYITGKLSGWANRGGGWLTCLLIVGVTCLSAYGQEAAQPASQTQKKPADALIKVGKDKPQAEPSEKSGKKDQGGPRIQIPEPIHDFGQVWIAPTLSHTFEVRNVGDQVLKITNVKPGCGCTLKGQYDKEIAPGGVGKIPLTLKTRGLKKFTKSITVSCNDPNNATQRLQLKGEIKYYVSAEPMRVNFARIKADEKVKQVVKIVTNTDDAKLELQGSGKMGKFQAALTKGKAPNEYQLTVEGLPPFVQGANSAKYTIKTGVPQQPTLEIPVSAYVPARLEIRPAQLIIPRPSEKPSRRTVIVTNNGDTPVEVLSVAVSNPEITATVQEQKKGQNYRVAINLPANYLPPPKGDKLTLKLLDGTEREHIVPIVPRRDAHKPRPQRPAMTLLGKPAPKTTLKVHDGGTFQVGSTEQVVVLDFFASWCGFCKRQLPNVEKAYQAFKDNPKVRFIGVSQDSESGGKRSRTPEQVVAQFKERGLTFDLALDPNKEAGGLYKAMSFPTLFVLGATGQVEAVHVGAKQNLDKTLIEEINTLLAGKSLVKKADKQAAPQKEPILKMKGLQTPKTPPKTTAAKKPSGD